MGFPQTHTAQAARLVVLCQLAVRHLRGQVRSSLSQQTPPYPNTPHSNMSCLPGPSASPQERQEEGPAGWRGLLKPVDKKSPAER